MENKIIATIKLENGKGRGNIFAKLENNDFFQAGVTTKTHHRLTAEKITNVG